MVLTIFARSGRAFVNIDLAVEAGVSWIALASVGAVPLVARPCTSAGVVFTRVGDVLAPSAVIPF